MHASTRTWQTLGDGVFRRRWESLDLNTGLILGDEEVLAIESRASHGQADELLAEIAAITSRPVTVLVNTHHHWDHTFGDSRFSWARIIGHERCRDTLVSSGEEMRDRLLTADRVPDGAKPHSGEVLVAPPTDVFTDSLQLDLGARVVELSFLGRGHTDNDIVIGVDDVLFAGDLVEEGAPPQFGDAFPLEWLETLDRLAELARDVVVPGHGDVVDSGFVVEQRHTIARAIDGEAVFPDQIMEQLRRRLDA